MLAKKTPPRKKTASEIPIITQQALLDYLADNLQLSLDTCCGGLTDPNTRRINLTLENKLISSVEFSVVQRREYEG